MSNIEERVKKIVSEQLAFHKSKGRKILVVTGRDGVCRKVTEDWLDLHELEYDEMFMRPIDDYRKDTAIKKEIYLNEIKDKYNYKFANLQTDFLHNHPDISKLDFQPK